MTEIREARHNKVLPAERREAVLIVSPAGDAVGFSEVDLHNELRILLSLLDGENLRDVVVDLGGANYFGSIVIGCISSLGQKAEKVGGRLLLCRASTAMLSVLEAMHLLERWPNSKSRRAALRELK